MRFQRLIVFLGAGFLWHCSSSGSGSDSTPRGCGTDADCGPGGACIESACAADCSVPTDCGRNGTTCGIAPNGTRHCVPNCSGDPVNLAYGGSKINYACADGVSTSCAVLDDTYCGVCGCASGMVCVDGVGCRAKVGTGEACTRDADCKSNNCSTSFNVCRVPVGQPCDSTNCDICKADPSIGYAFCSRSCPFGSECNGAALCLGVGDDPADSICSAACSGPSDPSCPGGCLQLNYDNGAIAYSCGCPNCTTTIAPLPIGAHCTKDADCPQDLCNSTASCTGTGCVSAGYCSRACALSADCPKGYRCANTGAPKLECVPQCTTSCNFGTCTSLMTAEGDTDMLCQVKRPDGGQCASDVDCVNSKCLGHTCSSGPLANGGMCVNASDCQSKVCRAGYCLGAALLGDPCSIDYDCAVGSCCKPKGSTGTCATTCP
jgi:hypothetical protein